MFLTYLGHSTVYFGNGEENIIIDPFIRNNPECHLDFTQIQVTYVFVTHGHADYLSDAIELCKRQNAVLVANVEICHYAMQQGIVKILPMNIGGEIVLPFGHVKMVPALHSSTIVTELGQLLPGGLACGYVIEFYHRKFYHAGDTALTYDLKLLKDKKNRFDIAFLPVGGRYTMNVNEVIKAVKWLKPKVIIPMYYGPFPEMKTSLKVLQKHFSKGKTLCKVMKPVTTIRGSYEKHR
ncbi:MAG: metal-dependent hydrolase [Culicoidibacterales bacterium]